ncbi:DUF4244 domain-containing protein [Streptomyces sp. NRRL WC-3742]
MVARFGAGWLRQAARRRSRSDAGMTTAEYAVGTLVILGRNQS